MELLEKFKAGLAYQDFLDRYANPDQRRRWDEFHAGVSLDAEQKGLLQSFVREMKVLVAAGAWCGDCVNQCPIFDRFAMETDKIQVRYLDRDDHPDFMEAHPTCGGARVPVVVFLSEDGHICGRSGDRTLSKYREMAQFAGATCPTGLVSDAPLTQRVVQDWLNEFERIQWMLRTSSRLRQLHGD